LQVKASKQDTGADSDFFLCKWHFNKMDLKEKLSQS
jgi:hypothetical protein